MTASPNAAPSSLLRVFVDGQPDFAPALAGLHRRGEADFSKVEEAVRGILRSVQEGGDEAVLAWTERFDKRRPERLVLREYGGAEALARLPADARAALEVAAERIRAYHEHQKDAGFVYDEAGVRLGTRVRPLDSVGVYAPGGKARYPSSILMAAIPAAVAGVKEVVLASPLWGDEADTLIYAAAHLSGVTTIVNAGGAQAIAALAYGTKSIPRVDKIVGPGNIYVACAKRLVYGTVSIDSIAGPSEILVVADESADAAVIAADLLSQAEHDEAAYPLLVASSLEKVRAVEAALEAQLRTLPRETIARASLAANGYAFVVPRRERMAEVANALAAEHLSVQVEDADALLDGITHAGAAFIGGLTPEAAGDYLAGPSHVLPTGGAVRFGAPLGVYDFVTRTSIIKYSREALAAQAPAITRFARLEGLEAHARAVEVRLR